MPKTNKTVKELEDAYTYLVDMFNKNNIELILFYGSLLGYTRNNDFIEGDDDIDVIVNIDDYDKVLKIISNNKLYCNICNKHIIQLNYNQVPFDIYFFEKFHDHIHIYWDGGINIDNKEIFPLKNVVFKNQSIMIPNNIEHLCYLIYGDNWKIPTEKKKYNWLKITKLKVGKKKM